MFPDAAVFHVLRVDVAQAPGTCFFMEIRFRTRIVVDVRFGYLGQAMIGAPFLVERLL